MFRASKAKTPVTYSKNGLCTPLKRNKAHCKGVGGFLFCFCFFVLFFAFPFFFIGVPDPGSRVPGPVCSSVLVLNWGSGWKGCGPDGRKKYCAR